MTIKFFEEELANERTEKHQNYRRRSWLRQHQNSKHRHPTGITAYDTEPIFSGNILEYNGTYYRIGEGHKEFIPDKAMDEDYYLLTLMAVARELNAYGIREADVHLAAGLPLTWVRKQREDFRTYLLRNEYVSFPFQW